jgi:hypothetical protein
MALRKSLILRRLRSRRLEGRTTLVQPDFDFFTRSKTVIQSRQAAAARIPRLPLSRE